MNDTERYEALREQHRRLRAAVQAVIESAAYDSPGDDEPRVYGSQLRDLRRELEHEPQPHGYRYATMSVS